MWCAEVNLKRKTVLGEDLTTFKDLIILPKGTKITISRWNDDNYTMWHNTGRYVIEKGYVDESTMNVISYD